jgi:predicted sugar kinase
MCGAAEEELITQAAAAPNSQRQAMLELGDACMSAAAASDFPRFVISLERYMEIAARLFAPVQAGHYRDQRIAARVALARAAGLGGVGQSSWGPTVFGFASNDAIARQAADELHRQLGNEPVEIVVTRAANQGASWRQIATGVQHAS